MILLTNRRVSILISFHLYEKEKSKYNQAFNLSSIPAAKKADKEVRNHEYHDDTPLVGLESRSAKDAKKH